MQPKNNQSFLAEDKQAHEIFDIDASDHDITSVLRNRIAASEKFYESDPAYKISDTRKKNAQMLWGDHYKAGKYPTIYESSVKYIEPQIYAGIQTIIAYVTSRIHEVDARPFNDNVAGRMIAKDFAKFCEAHGIEHNLIGLLTRLLFDLMQKRVGTIKFVFDPNHKEIGEIIPKHVDPAKIVFDHEAGQDDNPSFIAEKINDSIQNIIARFPDQKDEILEHCNVKDGTYKQLQTRKDYFEVWLTGKDKDGAPEEQLVCFMGGLVMLKSRNPHWLYDIEEEMIGNQLPYPPKPYLTINLLNDGSNKLDQTSLIELVAPLNHALNRRKRTIAEMSERFAGFKVWAGEFVDKEDVEELSGEPDESLIADTDNASQVVQKVAPDYLPDFVYTDALDIRATIHSILGTPPNLRGDVSDTKTLGEAIMQRDQAEGRMETLVRALDNFMDRYYAMLLHFMRVYYTEEHWMAIAGDNGTFEYVMMQRDRLKDGLDVHARSGTNMPLDDSNMANIGVKLASMDRISNLDLYRMLKLPKAEEMAENVIKEQVDPTLLVKDIKEDEGDRTAYMDYEVIMAGKYAPPREDVKPGHIDTHREQISSDDFQKQPEALKQALIAHTQAEVDSLRRRAMAMEGALEAQSDAQNSPMLPGNPVPSPENPFAAPGQGEAPPAPAEPGAPPAPPAAPAPVAPPADVSATPQNPEPMLQ